MGVQQDHVTRASHEHRRHRPVYTKAMPLIPLLYPMTLFIVHGKDLAIEERFWCGTSYVQKARSPAYKVTLSQRDQTNMLLIDFELVYPTGSIMTFCVARPTMWKHNGFQE
ncbi:uncharacterized protein LAESUDRAFT_367440 [Laetiporus sulphureus 93-53]|uniref:Uncharacterized protein n=1 Tax=Laetiporus sulphureus 93-53 TaxID=1314785 RepID=A0A165CT16_9APHY|nr:uncharacterized protein LAESUDRAFT_367440 [Laetiporus sulphureus 93-53]KZT03387.1 hypothetical protein LAESUDRAFT_367440 [Laetiporus sulphureus 93-53]